MSGSGKRKVKKGSTEWWFMLAMTEAAEIKRRAHKLPHLASVSVDEEEINAIIKRWNRNVFKRLWMMLTNGDIRTAEVTK